MEIFQPELSTCSIFDGESESAVKSGQNKIFAHFDAKNRVFGAKTPLFLTFPIELTNFDLRFGISVKN